MNAKKAEPEKVVKLKPVVRTALNLLHDLQFKQLRHDEIYHSDICLLRIQARIAHHTLHLGKYSGKFVEALVAKGGVDYTSMIKTTLDAIIIVMSSANTLNLALRDVAGAEDDVVGALTGKQAPGEAEAHVLGFAVITGKLAKAVEALDHVEHMDSRTAYENGLKSMWKLLLKFWRVITEQKLDEALRKRMYTIESKNMFYGRHPNYENDYKVVTGSDQSDQA